MADQPDETRFALDTMLDGLANVLESITKLSKDVVEPGDYARALGIAIAKADAALTRVRIIRSLLQEPPQGGEESQ